MTLRFAPCAPNMDIWEPALQQGREVTFYGALFFVDAHRKCLQLKTHGSGGVELE